MVFSKKDIRLARMRNQKIMNKRDFEEGRRLFKKGKPPTKIKIKQFDLGDRLVKISEKQDRKFKKSLDFGRSLQ